MITTIVFDLGGVIIENPKIPLRLYCADNLGVNPDELGPLLDKYISDFQIGLITENKFWELITSDLDISLPKENSLWQQAIKSAFIIYPEMEELLKSLRNNNYRIVMLSNTEMPVLQVIKNSKINSFFDLRIFSCIEQVAKPESEIYNRLLTVCNSKPEELIFIDDREENVISAEIMGIYSIHFKGYDQLISNFHKYGLRI